MNSGLSASKAHALSREGTIMVSRLLGFLMHNITDLVSSCEKGTEATEQSLHQVYSPSLNIVPSAGRGAIVSCLVTEVTKVSVFSLEWSSCKRSSS